jgi:hypothetical protein
MSEKVDLSLNTSIFRVSFAHVFEKYMPKDPDPGYVPKFELVALFSKTGAQAEEVAAGLALMKEAADKAVAIRWPNGAPDGLRTPFRDGNTKKYDGYKDTTFVRLSSEYKPKIINLDKQRLLTDDQFYSGCWAHARVKPYCYDKKGNQGVSFGLGNVLFIRDDSPFGGGSAPEDDFGDLVAAGAAAPAVNVSDDMFS